MFSSFALFAEDRSLPKIIYEDIQRAIGDPSDSWPKLEVTNRKKSIAAYRKSDNTILLEEDAVNVCKGFGDNAAAALAFLIGHELTHFYRHQEWDEIGFGSSFALDSVSWNTYRNNEYEADLYGAFLAYISDHDVRSILPKLLDQLYKVYAIPHEETTSYPSLDARKTVIKEMRQQVDLLIQIYESAHLCQAINQPFLAAKSYEYILNFVQTYALHKNHGMSLLKSAASGTNVRINQFSLPMNIERDLPVRGSEFRDQHVILRQAISAFRDALSSKEGDFDAQMGLVVTYGMLSKFDSAQTILDTILSDRYDPLQMAKFHVIRGIIYALQDKSLDATLSWKLARRLDPSESMRQLVKSNQQVLRGKSTMKFAEPRLIRVLNNQDPILPESSIYLPDRDPLMRFRLDLNTSGDSQTITYSNPNLHLSFRREESATYPIVDGESQSYQILGHSWGHYKVDWSKQLIWDIRHDEVNAVYTFGLTVQ